MPAPLRLLMLSHYFEERRGGIELVAAALARELALHGMAVTWLAASGARAGPDGERDGYRRGALHASALADRLLHIPYPLLLPSAWRRIFREAARHDVILVHDALYMTSIVAYLAARVHHRPLVVVQHVGFVPYRSALLRTLMRLANLCVAAPILRRSERVVFVSQLTLRHFAHLRWRRAPALIFNGVDTGTFWPALDARQVAEARRDLGLAQQGPVVLFVGRFVEKKGLHILERMARAQGDVLLALAGSGALDPARWQLSNVRVFSDLTGAALATLYRASDLMVLPSAGEGFPLVVQEALACGLAVICGTDTASADLDASALLNGVDVELADPERTARRFCAVMMRLLASPDTAAERRRRSEYARSRYSWAASAATYAKLLHELHPSAALASELPSP